MGNGRPELLSLRLHGLFWAKRALGRHAIPIDRDAADQDAPGVCD